MNGNSLKELLLMAPESQLNQSARDSINEWTESPRAIQILKTLDICVHGGLASSFVISVLEQMLIVSCKEENTTYEEVVKEATWR
jgi:hypothetical protein